MGDDLRHQLIAIADCLRPTLALRDDGAFDEAWTLARRLGTQVLGALRNAKQRDARGLQRLLAAPGAPARANIQSLCDLYRAIALSSLDLESHGIPGFADNDLDGYVNVMEQELCLQLEMEESWKSLVHSMVTNCSQIDASLNDLRLVLQQAVRSVVGRPCAGNRGISLPPTLETSLDSIVDRVERSGLGRPNRVLALQRRR